MLRVLGCITEQHDLRLVVLAALICVFSCYTAFSLLSRAHISRAQSRSVWLIAAAVVAGSGVWTTHFVAELAYMPGMAMGFDLSLTLLSVVIAVSVAGLGLAVALRPGFSVLGGAVVGMAVAAMHYTGMSALDLPARAQWDMAYVAASLVLAVSLGALALWRAEKRTDLVGRLQATGILVLAIVALHFTGMTAVTFVPDPSVTVSAATVAPQWLAVAVAAVTFMILGLGLAGSVVDEHLAQRSVKEADRLREYVSALEATKLDLENTTAHLRSALNDASAASAAKSQFLAAMSHELRTPLNAIIGFSEILKNQLFGPVGDRRYTSYHAEIHNSGKHLLGLINDILDFSKMEAGSFELREEKVDLRELSLSSLHIIQAQADKGKVRLSAAFDNNIPPVKADPQRIRQILLNLLSNAVKFTPERGEVCLTVSCTGDGIALAVSDTGIGMAADHIAKAFELFGQVDNALSRKYEGTGLGLPLAKQLTDLHGGSLSIQSKPGLGTTATVLLPASRIILAEQAA